MTLPDETLVGAAKIAEAKLLKLIGNQSSKGTFGRICTT